MPVTHEPWLVALSLIVAIQGAYVGLSLAVQIGKAFGLRRSQSTSTVRAPLGNLTCLAFEGDTVRIV